MIRSMKGKKLLSLIILILIWALLSTWVHKVFLPSPLHVVRHLAEPVVVAQLLKNIAVSLLRVFSALLLALIPALALGIAAGRNSAVDSLVSPMMYVLFPIPKIALLPLIILLFGLGNESKIFMVSLIVFFQFYLNIHDGVREIDSHYFDSFHSLGGNFQNSLIHLILPAILPRIFSTLRLTLGTGIAVLFLTETYASRSGIGWYIMDAWSRLDYPEMYAGIVVLGAAGFMLIELVNLGQYLLCPWERAV